MSPRPPPRDTGSGRPPAPDPSTKGTGENLVKQIKRFCWRTLVWARDRLPPGIRSILGLLFCVGGVFGFLPVLGFWMFPLGLCLIGLDVPFMRSRLNRIIERLERDLA
ncbi:MAG: hypothetical protein AAGG11_13580 [Pseudomonadota bacterium]